MTATRRIESVESGKDRPLFIVRGRGAVKTLDLLLHSENSIRVKRRWKAATGK